MSNHSSENDPLLSTDGEQPTIKTPALTRVVRKPEDEVEETGMHPGLSGELKQVPSPSTPTISNAPESRLVSSADPLLKSPLNSLARMERVEGWGMAHAGDCYVLRPSNKEQLADIFTNARRQGMIVTLRGSGQSYGDASIGQNSIVLDCSRMNRILHWDPVKGILEMEPGVTIADMWRYVLEDGWWPPVVSGTMRPTIGGALGMNIHGKNNYKVGPIGDHVLDFDLLTPRGETIFCSRTENADIFQAAIGSFGVLGMFTRIRLQMKRVYSGDVEVWAASTRSIGEMIEVFENNLDCDYLVGWIDGIAEGQGLGRGLIHLARHLKPGEDPNPDSSMKIVNQELPDTLFGFFPKSLVWLGLWVWGHRPGMRFVNATKYHMGRREAQQPPIRQSHAGFNFLLDYVPRWKWSYKPGGLIQYQTFVPKEHAEKVFEEQLRLSHEANLPPFLAVFKKHRPDPFWMTHAVDGYSFALDYPVTLHNRERLYELTREMTKLVLAHGGRFYFAKDGVLEEEDVKQAWPAETLEKFRAMKHRLDPHHTLQTDLSRRLFSF